MIPSQRPFYNPYLGKSRTALIGATQHLRCLHGMERGRGGGLGIVLNVS